jgi:protein-S-isoprenylcysteine O-methyltransferase Ste14
MIAAMLAAFIYRICVEEALLAEQFGDESWVYVERTPAKLIPGVF